MTISTKSRILKLFLDISSLGGIVYFMATFRWYLKNAAQNNIVSYINVIVLIGGFLSLFYLIFNLREILKTLLEDDPFVWKNVKRIKNVAKCSFIMSLCYLINIFVNRKIMKMKILVIDDYGIHTDWDFMIFFMAGGFIYILGKVFEKAVQYKEDNDLTI